MAVLKGTEIDRFLANPDPARPVILIYGPDAGLVAERARLAVSGLKVDVDDPFSVVHIDGDSLSGDPARLADEANTVSMFGGRRLIWLRAGEKPFPAAATAILGTQHRDCTILIEAGDLKKTAALRVEAEKSAFAAVIPCYADSEADIRRLISEETKAAQLAIEPEAANLLVAMLGGNRAASRSEVRKLCLYTQGQGTITAADVEAIAGEALELDIDQIVDAAAGGQIDALDSLFGRAMSSGAAIPQIMTAMSRHISALHKARLSVEAGASPATAAAQFQPPLFFRRKASVERQIAAWNSDRLQKMASRIADAILETRQNGDLAATIAGRALLSVAMNARSGRRG